MTDVPTKSRREVSVKGMVQMSNYAPTKGATAMSSKEEYVLSTGQRLLVKNAAMTDAITKLVREEYAKSMGLTPKACCSQQMHQVQLGLKCGNKGMSRRDMINSAVDKLRNAPRAAMTAMFLSTHGLENNII